ncbi:MAG: cytochrome c family protein [Planctomycetota bacterium]
MRGRAPLFILVVVACTVAAFLALASSTLVPAVGQEGVKYIGSAKCKMCHADQHKAWGEMKHSHAFDYLTPEQVATGKDEKGKACAACHTTGYGKGGFESVEKTPKLTNVGCESCHGAGQAHQKAMLMAMQTDETPEEKQISKNVGCAGCHNPHISYKKLYGKK